jgi:hypothetical protein
VSTRQRSRGQRSKVGHAVNLRAEPRGDQRDLAGPEPRCADVVPHPSPHERIWQGRQCFPGEPRGTGLGFQPGHQLVLDAESVEPPGPWHAVDGRRPPHTRRDKGPTGREVHELPRADAEHGVHAGLDEGGQVGVGTQAPIRHQHTSGGSHRVHRVHLGQVVGQGGRDDPREEHPGARMAQPQEVGHGEAAPRPWPGRLAEGGLSRRRLGHGAARAADETRATALPPPFS